MSKVIIDVSQYNGSINWNKVDCDGVFIRVGYRGYTAGSIKQDKRFLENIKGANNASIATGCYFMSQAINKSEAIEEANYIAEQIKSYEVMLPIFYDSELSGAKNNTGRADNLSKSLRTTICKAFCNRMKELGFLPGVYASTSWFRSNLDVSQLLEYNIWVAQYASNCTAAHRKDMWQYTSKGNMAGISGNVDISHCYTDFNISNSKVEVSKTVAESADYISGTYQLTVNLNVRTGPGTNYKAKSYSQLTKDGKAHATLKGVLKSGTRVTVSEVIRNDSDVWGRIPSGYIALYYNKKDYAIKDD